MRGVAVVVVVVDATWSVPSSTPLGVVGHLNGDWSTTLLTLGFGSSTGPFCCCGVPAGCDMATTAASEAPVGLVLRLLEEHLAIPYFNLKTERLMVGLTTS